MTWSQARMFGVHLTIALGVVPTRSLLALDRVLLPRDSERLDQAARRARNGRTPGAWPYQALASASPGRSESPGTALPDDRSSSGASVRGSYGTEGHRFESCRARSRIPH
jgi:hypothetical protein